jgi:type 1 glutamine amidotransferase
MDLRDDIHTIAVATTPKKGDKPDVQTQIWTYEKAGAQRAVGFIPGHTYVNFSLPNMRLLIARSIAWAGRRDPLMYDSPVTLQICPVFIEPAKAK